MEMENANIETCDSHKTEEREKIGKYSENENKEKGNFFIVFSHSYITNILSVYFLYTPILRYYYYNTPV